MLHTVSLEDYQFKQLVTVLFGDEKRLSVIVDNLNTEALARYRGDNEIKTMVTALTSEVAMSSRAVTQLLETLDAEGQA